MEGIPELGLKFESSCVQVELEVEWPSLAIQITLNGWLSDHGTSDNHLYGWWLRWLRESETLWLVAEMAKALMEALKTALISQLVLIPWLSSLGDGYLTFWLGKNSPRAW